MTAGSLLARSIIVRGYVEDDGGFRLPLHSHTRMPQNEFLATLVRNVAPTQSVEVGLAFGLSTLCICDELAPQKKKKHFVFDPFQHDRVWRGIGVRHIEEAGYASMVAFVEERAERALPRLADAGERIQFAYVDGDKRFDTNLVCFWALDRMLDVGGILAWDDCDWPSLRRLCRFIAQHPNYGVHARYGESQLSRKRRLLYRLARLVPIGAASRQADALVADQKLGINAHCVAFVKRRQTELEWDWSVDF